MQDASDLCFHRFSFYFSSIRSGSLCLGTTNKDPQWQSFVRWVVTATIIAEERGIQQEKAETMPTVGVFGADQETMFQSVIASIGNYGEIYNRNLERLVPRGGPNQLNRNPQDSIKGPPTYIPPGLFVDKVKS